MDLSTSLRALVAVLLLDACSLLAPSDAELRGERADIVDSGGGVDGGGGDVSSSDGAGGGDGSGGGDVVSRDAPSNADASGDCAPLCAIVPPSCLSDPCSCATAPACGAKTCTGVGGKTTVGCDGVTCTATATTITCTDGTLFCHCL